REAMSAGPCIVAARRSASIESILRHSPPAVVARVAGGDEPAAICVHLHAAGLAPESGKEARILLAAGLLAELELVAARFQRPRGGRFQSRRLDVHEVG